MVVTDGTYEVKASEIDRAASRKHLERRLGPLGDHRARQAVAARTLDERAERVADPRLEPQVQQRGTPAPERTPIPVPPAKVEHRRAAASYRAAMERLYLAAHRARAAFRMALVRDGREAATKAFRERPESFGPVRPGTAPVDDRAQEAAREAFRWSGRLEASGRADALRVAGALSAPQTSRAAEAQRLADAGKRLNAWERVGRSLAPKLAPMLPARAAGLVRTAKSLGRNITTAAGPDRNQPRERGRDPDRGPDLCPQEARAREFGAAGSGVGVATRGRRNGGASPTFTLTKDCFGMDDLRPTPAEHRNAGRAVLLAFRAVFADELAARRTFRAALDGRGRIRALLALRTTPERFGERLPHVDPRVLDLADEAVEAFARCRERCTRPLMREALDFLQRGYVERRSHQERCGIEAEAQRTEDRLDTTEKQRKRIKRARQALDAIAKDVYRDPAAAVEVALRYAREHGTAEFSDQCGRAPHLFGMLLTSRRTDWLGWFGVTQTGSARSHAIMVPIYVKHFLQQADGFPTEEEQARARADAEAAAAALAALGPATPDPWRASTRLAAPQLFEVMRLMDRRPLDAAPEVHRQLAGINDAVELAVQLDGDHRRGDEFSAQGGRAGGYFR
jgi:hypothetical protein